LSIDTTIADVPTPTNDEFTEVFLNATLETLREIAKSIDLATKGDIQARDRIIRRAKLYYFDSVPVLKTGDFILPRNYMIDQNDIYQYLDKNGPDPQPTGIEYFLSVGLLAIFMCRFTLKDGELQVALSLFSQAGEYLGLAKGYKIGVTDSELKSSESYRARSKKRHAGDFTDKAEVLKFYTAEENIGLFENKNFSQSAEIIFNLDKKITHAELRTIKDWISKYEKEQRHAKESEIAFELFMDQISREGVKF
jgi:hypothetical protein